MNKLTPNLSIKAANLKGYLYKKGNDPKGISMKRLLTSRFFMYSIDGNDDASKIILGSLNSSFNIQPQSYGNDMYFKE